ncbi:MAG: MlaE family ABC transporter permease [Planctomycetota bacterium]|jgi:phospholipid/cholesterol/gamma-HCH transport system permease protein
MALHAEDRNPIETVGAKVLSGVGYVGGMMLLLGSTVGWAVRGLSSKKFRFGREALAKQMVRVGVKSLGIVVLVQTFIGVILALQMAPPLSDFGQEASIANIIGIAGFRMLGPIITAVILSGFAGASIAAELGTMVVSEEIQALEAFALNPVRFLVVPRLLATLMMTVLLTVLADLTIALGGWLAAHIAIGPEVYVGYWTRMRDQLRYRDFVTGLIQAGVFGVLISLIACHEGLRVTGGAEGVGRATTMTVVYSIVAIIAAACVFTIIFYVFGL